MFVIMLHILYQREFVKNNYTASFEGFIVKTEILSSTMFTFFLSYCIIIGELYKDKS